jgi:hypothetical protein
LFNVCYIGLANTVLLAQHNEVVALISMLSEWRYEEIGVLQAKLSDDTATGTQDY